MRVTGNSMEKNDNREHDKRKTKGFPSALNVFTTE